VDTPYFSEEQLATYSQPFFPLFEGKVIFLREETKGLGVYARIYKDKLE